MKICIKKKIFSKLILIAFLNLQELEKVSSKFHFSKSLQGIFRLLKIKPKYKILGPNLKKIQGD